MNRIICTLFIVTAIALCSTAEELACTVRCVPGDNGNERTFIKGVDGVEREVKILSPEEYAILTNRLEAAWAFMHTSHNNRMKIHGPKVREYVDDKNNEKITEYKDGYRYVEKMAVRPRPVHKPIYGTAERIPRKPRRISERQWKARQEREAAEKVAPRVVNVIYNANDGTTKEVK